MILNKSSEFKMAEPFTDTVRFCVFFSSRQTIANKPFDVLKVFLWQLRKTLWKVKFGEFTHV